MAFSIRLDPDTERALARMARDRRQSRASIVREAIEAYGRTQPPAAAMASPYDRIAHLIGVADSGGARLSEDTGSKFRELLVTKARARRVRRVRPR